MSIFSHRSRSSGKRGFTLIELLVVLAIITIITAALLVEQRRFDSSTLLRSLAYSVALSVRQAQVYGTSARQFDTTANGFNYSYGVYFDNKNSYVLFADVSGDRLYTSSPTDEKVQRFNISGEYEILQFCAVRNSNEEDCFGGGKNGGTQISSLTIFFRRPNPDAQFFTGVNAQYKSAYIKVKGPNDVVTRTINVTTPGQIYVTSSALGL